MLDNKLKNNMNHMSSRDINSILIYKLENLLKSIPCPKVDPSRDSLLFDFYPLVLDLLKKQQIRIILVSYPTLLAFEPH
jgi:hypothetical protein